MGDYKLGMMIGKRSIVVVDIVDRLVAAVFVVALVVAVAAAVIADSPAWDIRNMAHTAYVVEHTMACSIGRRDTVSAADSHPCMDVMAGCMVAVAFDKVGCMVAVDFDKMDYMADIE